MGLFSKKKGKESKKAAEKKAEFKEYIKGAGGSIVSKSILNGASKLKWLFREDSEHGNGWIAFGDTDTQEYVDNAENMVVVDFNVLANIEPTVLNVYYMPVGSDLEFRFDKTGKYFVDTRTGKEIREPVKHPAQAAFEKNLKFLNQETYPMEFFEGLFAENGGMTLVTAGQVDFPTGEVVLADPLAYLGTKYSTVLERKVTVGSYPVELSVCSSDIVGIRVAAARLILSDKPAVRYEIAMPKGSRAEDFGKPKVFTFFGVDCGLVLRIYRQRRNTGNFLSGGKVRIRERISTTTISPRFLQTAMRNIPRSRIRAGTSCIGRSRGQGINWRSFPAVWETAFIADTGGLMNRARRYRWWFRS